MSQLTIEFFLGLPPCGYRT